MLDRSSPSLVPTVALALATVLLASLGGVFALRGSGHGGAGAAPDEAAAPIIAAALPETESPFADDRFPELIERAGRISAGICALGSGVAPLGRPRVHEWTKLEAPSRQGAVQRTGWFDTASRTLVVNGAIPSSEDDALFALAEAELSRVLGAPATPWFARGMAHSFVGRSGGFALEEIEARTGSVTPDEVFGPVRGRNRITLAPAEVRLARCLLAEYDSKVQDAWGVRVEGNEELRERLRQSWDLSLLRIPIRPRAVSMRRPQGGAYVELKASGEDLASAELLEALDRIAALGFQGIALQVHVPVAPPGPGERREPVRSLVGWGDQVTVEGDGAVLACAVAAGERGLGFTLVPSFITSETGGPGRLQIHGSAERLRLYGDRRALAMEGVAWLAEQAGAAGLLMFDAEDLPRADPDAWPVFGPELLAARESTRRQSLVYSQPFTGERLAFVQGNEARDVALENLAADLLRGVLRGPLGHVELRVGLDVPRRLQGGEWAERRRFVDATSEPERAGFVLVGPWFVAGSRGGPGGRVADLGDEDDAALQKLARMLARQFSGGVRPGAAGPDRPR